jgi:hypothetical protein
MSLRESADIAADIALGRYAAENGVQRETRSETRRELRKNKRQIKREVKAEIRKRCSERYGFIGVEWIIFAVLSGIIQWAVKRWLDKRFPPEDDRWSHK